MGRIPRGFENGPRGIRPLEPPGRPPRVPRRPIWERKKLPKRLWGTVKLTMRDARSRKQIWSPVSRNVLLQADSSRVSRYRYRYRYRCRYRYRYRYSHRYRYRYRYRHRYRPKGFPRGPGRLPKGAQEEGRGAYPQRLRKRAPGDTPFGAPRTARRIWERKKTPQEALGDNKVNNARC